MAEHLRVDIHITNIRKRGPLYVAQLEGHPEIKTKPVVEPFFTIARSMMDAGFPPRTRIGLYRKGSDVCSMAGNIFKLSQLNIVESANQPPRIGKWVPRPDDASGGAEDEDEEDED